MQTNLLKTLLVVILLLGAITSSNSQVKNNFEPRYQNNLRGDITFVANNIVNRESDGYWQDNWVQVWWWWENHPIWVDDPVSANDPYNLVGGASEHNHNLDMHYIDVDNDNSTFSSSSAELAVPDINCAKVRYVGLYWSAVNMSSDRSNLNQVKFKVPGGSYLDITADELIYDGYGDADFGDYSPYAYYKDVTSLVTGLANPNGEYFVANIRASIEGDGNTAPFGGISGGWNMVVVYENPNLPGKYITTFDGYAGIKVNETVDIPVNGFTTLPAPFPVNAKLGVVALEGDNKITGDALSIKANSNATYTTLGNTVNPTNNFYNSNITLENNIVTTRNPNSINTLGWDSDLFTINNQPANAVIPNDETGVTLRASSTGDKFDIFFTSFDVEIIEPIMNLVKTVEDIGGNDITGQGVNLGQYLDYVLTFQNVGNDNGANYTIRDVLPINVTLDETNITLPAGVTYTFNAATRTIIFSIPNNLVEEDDPAYTIRMRVQVAENCFDFIDACTDVIQNLAYSTYQGVINTAQITDDPSVTDFDNCGFTTPGATNFLLDDLENCDFNRTVQLCGDDVMLDAGDNFDDYIWYKDENGDGEIDGGDTVVTDGNSDNDLSTLVVSETGVYIVDKIIADPCKGFQEIITVESFGETQTNPITALINDITNTVDGEVVICPNDGEELPKIFLCGLNDNEPLQLNIPDALSISWEQLDEGSCSAVVDDCANKNSGCTWSNVGSGINYTAADAGEYRIVVSYQNGCTARFYFNVFKNPLDPQYNSSDIICNTPGNITVTNVPANYEYQLLNASNDNVLVAYQNSPSFSIANNGGYTVEIRQQGVVDGCVFRLENIGILARDYDVDIITKDTDCNGLGEITISALDVEPQYYYEISLGGSVVDTYGPSNDNNYTFQNLNDGTYDVVVTTDDGCNYTEQVTINDVTDLAGNAVTTKAIDCTDGEIEVTGSGGVANPGYSYAIWNVNGTDLYADITDIPPSEFQSSSTFIFDDTEAGDYSFIVVDSNNCYVISNVASIAVSPAITYTTSQTNETCLGANDGSYAVNVSNSNGYSVSYTLTFPNATAQFNSSGSFTGLPQGNYSLVLTQTDGTNTCDFTETFTIGGPVDSVTGTAVLIQDYTCLQDATIEAQGMTGGAAPYEYSIDGVTFVNGAGSETFSGLTDGAYSITIRDANGCTFVTNEITINPLNEPTDLTFTATTPNCPTLTSDVVVTVVDGNAPFTFAITAPNAIAATSVSGNTANFNGLAPDTYTFSVTDDKGCVYTENFTISPVTPIAATGSLISNITCFDDTDGAATFTVSGFNTSFDYTITGPSASAGTAETNGTISLNGLDDGVYTINVTDTDTNCTATANITISAPASALAMTVVETQPTCGTDGSVNLSASGGWGGNSFTITYPDGTTTFTNSIGLFSSLNQAGTYNVSVEDANGCIVSDAFVLNAAVAPTLEIIANDLCYDATNGLTLTANVTAGGDGNYTYRINGGAYGTNNVFAGLTPGSFTIDVLDGNNCTDTASITIDPELSVTATAANITACGTDTNVTITAAGGDGNFVYALVADGVTPNPGDFNTTNPITTSGAGEYDVYVRDNNGVASFCESVYDLTIAQDNPLTMSITNTPILCSGETQAAITITPTGGQAPFEYSIDGGTTYQPTNTFTNQGAGSYTINVRDANGCIISEIYTITEPFNLSASAAVTQLTECNPGIGAEVRITNAVGGTAPYEYSFDGGSSYAASSISNLLPGNHTLFIRDANNCSYEMTVIIDPEPTPPNLTAGVTYDCEGEGTITITPDNPAYNYTYAIDGTPNTPTTNNIFNDVAVGNHTITVDYINNTPPTPSNLLLENFGTGANTSISQIDPVYCYEPQDGSVRACDPGTPTRINDGEYSVTQVVTAPFSSWLSPNDHTGTPGGRFLAINVGGVAGVGGIIYAKRAIEVMPNRDITVSLWAFNLLTTGSGGGDPSVEIQLVDGGGTIIASTTTGNVPKNNNANDWHNYSVTLDPGANTNLDIVIRTNSAVTGGNDIAIDDIEAFQLPEVCSSTTTIDVLVEDGHAFDAGITSSSNLDCNADNTGSITFEVENFGASGFEYSLDNFTTTLGASIASTVTINTLAAGNYTITVRDVDNPIAGCSETLNITLTEPAAIVTTATITEEFTCNNTGATITASASGGTPSYEYQLENNVGGIITAYQNSAIFNDVPAGDYIVRARDTNLCADPIDTAITISAPVVPTFNTIATACYTGNNDGEIQVDITSIPGNGDFQFRINGGPWVNPNIATPTTYTFTGLANGSYDIDVKDGFGCDAVQQTIVLDPSLTAIIDIVHLSSCADGSITVNAAGGDGNYAYAFVLNGTPVTPGDFGASNVFTVTTGNDGDYDIYVRDNSGTSPFCQYTETITVNGATPLTYTAIPTDPECHDGFGQIDITVTSGIAPYTYQIIDLDNGGASNETNTNVINNTKTYFNLATGNYTINVTDATGCVLQQTPITVNNPDELVADVDTIIPPNCSVDPNDFGFVFTNYPITIGTLEFSDDGGSTWQSSNTFNGYNPGQAVNPSIRTVSGGATVCQTDFPELIIPYPLDDLNINVVPIVVNCNELRVTVQGTQGLAPYEYAYTEDPSTFNPATAAWTVATAGSHEWTGLIPGRTYVFYVRDNSPCIRQSSVNVNDIITEPIQIDAAYEPSCSGANDAEITYTLTPTTAEPGMRWELYDLNTGTIVRSSGNGTTAALAGNNIAYTSPIIISGLASSEYYIEVTQVDAVGPAGNDACIGGSENLIIDELDAISGTPVSLRDITCDTPGLIEIQNIIGGGGVYSYTLTSSDFSAPITGTTNNPIEVPISQIVTPNPVSVLVNVDVEDQFGCPQSLGAVTLNISQAPAITSIDVDNCAAPHTVTVNATSVAATILYSLDGGTTYANNGGVFNNVAVGTHNVSIIDSNGCTATSTITVHPALSADVSLTKLLDCTISPDAQITIDILTGSGDNLGFAGSYDYQIDNGLGSVVARTGLTTDSFVANVPVAETYTITIYDNNTNPICNRVFTIEVPTVVQPIFTETHVDITCNGANDGSITVVQTDNGINPLTYAISPVAGTFNAATNTFENLPPNTYEVIATGTNGCNTKISGIHIVEPNAIVINAVAVTDFACTAGNNSNSVVITVDTAPANITGGSGTYVIYEFVNNQGTVVTGDDVIVQSGSNPVYTETNTAGGNYTINVYDDNGCSGSIAATIVPFDELISASASITNDITCNPGSDGEITITATSTNNDTTKFEYSIDNGTTYQASNVFSGLDIGTHNFLVRHTDTGCIISTSETIVSPEVLELDVTINSHIVCFGGTDGQVQFNLHDNTNTTYPSTITWTLTDTNGTPGDLSDDFPAAAPNDTGIDPDGDFIISSLAAGSYYIEVIQTNAPECTYTQAFTINGPNGAITGNTTVIDITCVGNDGIIEIIDAQGGWGGYTYYVGVGSPASAASYNASPRFENLSAGTYEAWIRDTNGCEMQLPDVVLSDPTAITAALQINQENCTNLQGEIEVVGTAGGQGSNYSYQLIKDGTAFGASQNTTTFSGLGAGSYTVEISDQWSCTFTTAAVLLYEEFNLTTTVDKLIDCSLTPGGEITINVAGGSANMEFIATLPDGVTTITNNTGIFTGLTNAGTYSFLVRDLDTNNPTCEKTITQELDSPTAVTFTTHTIENVSCNGQADGAITVNLAVTAVGVNDNPVYTYNLYDATGVTLLDGPQNSATFTGLAAAFYQVEAVSARGCSLRETVEVTEPTALLIDASATSFVCNASNSTNTATITVSILDGATTPGTPSGTAPYLYSIDNINFQTSNSFDIVDTGVTQNITVYVTDGNSCPATTNVTIEPINTFTVAVTQNTAISCTGPEQITISVADNGNVGNVYTFELLPIGNPDGAQTATPTNTTAEFNLTQVGNYVFRITDTATGCYVDTLPYEILPYDLIEVAATATTPVTCFGDSTGALEINVTGYTGSYSYEIFDGNGITTGITGTGNTAANPLAIGGLSGGNYYVSVSQDVAPNCNENSNIVTIVSPDMALTASVTEVANVTCSNDLGEIMVDPSGGYAPYDIVLTNTGTGDVYAFNDVASMIFIGLSADNYTVAVTDDNGCVLNDAITLVAPTPITADITPPTTTLTCYGDTNGIVTAINVLGGQGVYQYQLNYYDATGTTIGFTSGAQGSTVFDNLGAGIYSITVSDGWNCDVETLQVTISEPTDVSALLSQTSPLTCNDPAEIELSAVGGTAPYEYSLDGVSFTPMSGGNTHTFSVSAGVFQYYVRDALGCEAMRSNQVEIDAVPALTITIDESAATINCTGEATATIIAEASGGLGNYTYELFTDAGLTNLVSGPQNTGTFSNLVADSYYLRVISDDCEEVSQEIIVTEPTPLVVTDSFTDVSCNGADDGTITVELSGGSGGYTYAISPNLDQFDTVNTFTELAAGTYTVIAQDINGCFEQLQYTIIEPTIMDVASTVTHEVCAGEADGSISIVITGGTAPYSSSLNSNNAADFIADQTSFADLAAGTYVVFVEDAQGCQTNIVVEVEAGVNINATAIPVYQCTGDTPSNYLEVTLEDPSVSDDVLYALDSQDAGDLVLSPDFSNIAPGNHYLYISHANGCAQVIDFVIDSFDPLVLTLEQNNINEITAIASGGKQDYTFYFDGEDNGTDNTFLIKRTDTYTVRVVDENGCESSADIFIEFIDIEIPNFFTPDGDGLNDTWKPRNTEIFPEILTLVFDRYGREVYRMSAGDPGWNGIYQGTGLPTGDYWYVIKLQGESDDREFVGHFTMYR